MKSPFIINLTLEEEQTLQKNISCGKTEQRLVLRSNIILLASQKLSNIQIARILKISVKTVSKWRKRFYDKKIDGLFDRPRSGHPKVFTLYLKYELVHLACDSPEKVFRGVTKWSYRKLALALIILKYVKHISFTRVMSWLKHMDIKPQKIKYYLKQTDPNFQEKMHEIIELYHNSPKNEPVICVDEKTGIQVLTAAYADEVSKTGKRIYREFEYVRNGTLCIFAGFDIETGKVVGVVRETHKTIDFIAFLKELLLEYKDKEKVHLVLDNFKTHSSKELLKWLDENPNPFVFHFLPFHGSWLNQIEIWFRIFNMECLKCANCESKDEMARLIYEYLVTYNNCFAHPFSWKYGDKLLNK